MNRVQVFDRGYLLPGNAMGQKYCDEPQGINVLGLAPPYPRVDIPATLGPYLTILHNPMLPPLLLHRMLYTFTTRPCPPHVIACEMHMPRCKRHTMT